MIVTKFMERRNGHRNVSKKIVVLYHAECTDGFTAAWVAFTVFKNKAQYISVEHQIPPPDGLVGKIIYMLDFTYPREIMEQLIRDNERVTAIDHHGTAREATMMTEDYRYALEKSGSSLAWDYFHPNQPKPFLVRIVEDMDLYRFALPETETIFDWLDLFDYNFKVYSKLARTLDTAGGLRRAMRQGAIIRQYRKKFIDYLVMSCSYEVQFAEFCVRAVNTELYHSEVATALAADRPFGVVWRMRRKGVYVSLRSAPDGINVAQLAQRYGGGGHEHASGFLVAKLEDLPFTIIQQNNT
jgi:oligoribonuclease NrnB/cAMP/cGMP phosphodiesterase (DHH superfamily)